MTSALPFEPYGYQRAAAETFVKAVVRDRATRALIVLPTGCGKTRTAYLIAFGISKRTLFLAHTDQLVAQPEREVRSLFPDVRVGVVKAQRDDVGAAFVIASVQTLKNQERLEDLVHSQEHCGSFDLVIVDEAHHAIEGSAYQKVVDAFPGRPVLGLTATPERTDQKPIGKVFTSGILFRLTPKEAMDARDPGPFIVPISDGDGNVGQSARILVPNADLRAVARAADAGKAEKIALQDAVIDATVMGIRAGLERGRKVVCFTVNVAASEEVASRSAAAGLRVAAVHGGLKAREVAAILKRHRDGELQGLVNCQILLEGYDDPSVDGIVWARPTESRPLYVQGIGRGLRLDRNRPPFGSPGAKNDCAIFDLVGAHDAHGLQCGESLFSEEHVGQKEPTPLEELEKTTTEADGDDRETLLYRSFLACLAGKRVLEGTTRKRVGWVEVFEDRAFVLSGGDSRTYVVERGPSGGWIAFAEPRERGAPSWQLTGETTREEACRAAEENGALSGAKALHDRTNKWRVGKAGEKLLNALRRWHIEAPPGVTAGEAHDALSVAIARARMSSRQKRGVLPTGESLL